MKTKDTAIGTCALCRQHGPLCKSHALPHAHFKEIHRRNSGVATAITTGGAMLHKTSEGGAAFLLCAACENRLNLDFDSPSINYLRSARASQGASGPGFIAQFSSDILAWFMISVVWRAAVSPAPIYHAVSLSQVRGEALRQLLLHRATQPQVHAVFRIFDLYDSRGVFSRPSLNDFIMPPAGTSGAGVDFIANGFLFNVDFAPQTFAHRKRPGLLRPGVTVFKVPAFDLRKHESTTAMIRAGAAKYRMGHSSLKQRY